MSKMMLFEGEARAARGRGVNMLTRAVQSTLGPKGGNAVIDVPIGTPIVSRDGVSVLVGPPTLVPGSLQGLDCEVSHDLDEVLARVDVVNMLRVQFERLSGPAFPSSREYTTLYGLTGARLASAREAVAPPAISSSAASPRPPQAAST